MKQKQFQKDDKGQVIMSFKNVQICNEQAGLYGTPELNDQLYLHYKGFHKIDSLDRFTGIKSLYLNNNAIKRIENLDQNTQLISLYLNNNLIESMQGLGNLQHLIMLNLSHNRIETIQGLDNLARLSNLNLSTNRLTNTQSIQGVTQAKALTILDLSNNQIEPDEKALQIVGELPSLACLYFKNTQLSRQLKNYRKKLVSSVKSLTFLDDRPVSTSERRLTDAWARGGVQMESIERTKIFQEKQMENRKDFEDFQKLERREYIFQQLSKQEREELATLSSRRHPSLGAQQDQPQSEQANRRIESIEAYLKWLQQAVSLTSVHEGIQASDFEVEKSQSGFKLVNYYDQTLKKKYEVKQPETQPKEVAVVAEEADSQEESLTNLIQDQQQRNKRATMRKWDPELQPLLQTYLENLKFDFDEVFPQFNMAVSSIYKKQGREAVRFQAKELRKIWAVIEQQKRNSLQELD